MLSNVANYTLTQQRATRLEPYVWEIHPDHRVYDVQVFAGGTLQEEKEDYTREGAKIIFVKHPERDSEFPSENCRVLTLAAVTN